MHYSSSEKSRGTQEWLQTGMICHKTSTVKWNIPSKSTYWKCRWSYHMGIGLWPKWNWESSASPTQEALLPSTRISLHCPTPQHLNQQHSRFPFCQTSPCRDHRYQQSPDWWIHKRSTCLLKIQTQPPFNPPTNSNQKYDSGFQKMAGMNFHFTFRETPRDVQVPSKRFPLPPKKTWTATLYQWTWYKAEAMCWTYWSTLWWWLWTNYIHSNVGR